MAGENSMVSLDEWCHLNLGEVECILMSEDDPNPVPVPLSFKEPIYPPLQQQTALPATPTRFQSMVVEPEIMHPNNLFVDPLILHNDLFVPDFQMGTSSVVPLSFSSWPLQVPPDTCASCHILRDIVHTNGVDVTKLEVHGRLGLIYHAVLGKYCIDLTTNQGHDYTMFDFCKESMSRVKQFLREYCKERKRDGYVMLQDPLSSFYEAVTVGLDWEDSIDTDDLIPPECSGDHQTNQQDADTSSARPLSMKSQRQRTRELTMKDLVGYFHIPIEAAAKKLNMCPTVIKKICRKYGLERWPYRKIQSVENKISKRAQYLTSAEIDALRQEITNMYAPFNV